MDPARPALELNRDQTEGFETAFRAFAADCAKQADCPLGQGSPDAVAQRLKEFFRKVDAQPVPTTDRARPVLGEALATTGVIAALYDENAWPQLREALTAANNGDGNGLLALADSYYEREPDGKYANLMSANAAVNCLDQPPAFDGPEAVDKALPSFEKASPVFGAGLAWASLNCTYWPVKATGTARALTAKGAPPIVVVGTTRDPATPYKWARPWRASSTRASCSRTTETATPPTAAAATASTRRSTATSWRAPLRRPARSADPPPDAGSGHPV